MKLKLTIILLTFFNIALAQQPDVSYGLGNFDQKMPVKFIPSGAPSNAIIEKLAEGNGKGIRNTEINFSFTQTARLNYNGAGKEIVVTSTPFKTGGDFYYKGFSTADVCYPSRMQFTAAVFLSGKLLRNYDFSISIENGKPGVVTKVVTDSATKNLRVEIKNLRLEYSQEVINKFLQEVHKINDYYAADFQMNQVNAMIASVNPGNFEYLEQEERKLNDAMAIVNSIEACNYNSVLDLSTFDPVNLVRKISLFRSQAAGKRSEIENAYQNRYLSFYDQGMYFLHAGNKRRAGEAFEHSFDLNPSFAPALYQLARISFQNGRLEEAVDQSSQIMFQMNVDPETRNLTKNLVADIFESYLDNAASLLNQKKYRKADELLTKANDLCERFSGVRCSDELYTSLKKAHNGIYNEMLEECKQLLAQNRFDDAETRIDDAKSYRLKHKDEILSFETEGAIIKNINQKKFDVLVSDAKTLSLKKEYEKALNKLDDANAIAAENNIETGKDFNKLVDENARSLVADLIGSGNNYVTSNNLSEARKALDKADKTRNKYQLNDDKKLESESEKLRGKIFSQQCVNAQNDFNNYFDRGKKAVAAGDYRAAGIQFALVDSTIENNNDCNLKTGNYADERSAVIPAVTYLKLFDRSKDEMNHQQYRESFNSYNEAEKYFSQFDIGKYKITHQPRLEYILANGTDGLKFYAGSQYMGMNQLDNSVEVYKNLINKKYDARQLKGPLYKLGTAVAERDSKNATGSWKENVVKYTQGKKEWKSFRKGYKKGWKK